MKKNNNPPIIKIKKNHPNAMLPKYMTPGSSGMDIHACLDEPRIVLPKTIALISTGLCMEIPEGYEVQIRPRSGISLKHGMMAILGTVDSDYRGVVGVIMANLSERIYTISQHDRIAQMVFQKVERATLILSHSMNQTNRGNGGFGSTGV